MAKKTKEATRGNNMTKTRKRRYVVEIETHRSDKATRETIEHALHVVLYDIEAASVTRFRSPS